MKDYEEIHGALLVAQEKGVYTKMALNALERIGMRIEKLEALERVDAPDASADPNVGANKSNDRPEVTTICGSTRFPTANALAMMHLSLMGRIVIPCGLQGHADEPPGAKFLTSDGDENAPEKQGLDALHFHKIDMSDGIFVVNVGGYVGSSTRREIDYAMDFDKKIEWMFPPSATYAATRVYQDGVLAARAVTGTDAGATAPVPPGMAREGRRDPHMAVLLRAYAIYESRNENYQDMWKKYGTKGAMVQLRNCVERMWTMVFENQAAEPKADDLFDAINYAVFALRCLTEDIPGDWRWE